MINKKPLQLINSSFSTLKVAFQHKYQAIYFLFISIIICANLKRRCSKISVHFDQENICQGLATNNVNDKNNLSLNLSSNHRVEKLKERLPSMKLDLTSS